MNLWPSKQQWDSWTLPSRLTAVGVAVAVVSIFLTLGFGILGVSRDDTVAESELPLPRIEPRDEKQRLPLPTNRATPRLDEIAALRMELEAQHEALEQRLSRDNQRLRRELLEALIDLATAEQTRARGSVDLSPEGIRDQEQLASQVGESLVAIARTPEHTTDGEPERAAELETQLKALMDQNETLKRENQAFRSYVETGDSSYLDPVLEELGELKVGVIRSPQGTRVYSQEEEQQFLEDTRETLKAAPAKHLVRGTWSGYECSGVPWDCGDIEFSSPSRPDGHSGGSGMASSRRIQWYSGPEIRKAEEVLAKLSEDSLRLRLAGWDGSICQWYRDLSAGRLALS